MSCIVDETTYEVLYLKIFLMSMKKSLMCVMNNKSFNNEYPRKIIEIICKLTNTIKSIFYTISENLNILNEASLTKYQFVNGNMTTTLCSLLIRN